VSDLEDLEVEDSLLEDQEIPNKFWTNLIRTLGIVSPSQDGAGATGIPHLLKK